MTTTTIDYAKLLNREPHQIDRELVGDFLRDKVVAITGAGGTIGAELARQCDTFDCRKVVLIERAEPALVQIERQMGSEYRAYVTDVTREQKIREVFEFEQPDIVFHTAAHKHVPKTEEDPDEALVNNYEGLKHTAQAAARTGVGTFILISTDKAVMPTSTLGLTKALAEKYIQYIDARCSTCAFASVRFGNVIGSSGSVVEVWQEQLERGEPLTVTDWGMTRYFMSLVEASGLVLEATATTCGGETFVLDMGEPVPLRTLAQAMVTANRLDPVDVLAHVTKTKRPGEKMHEVLVADGEQLEPTSVDGIQRVVRC